MKPEFVRCCALLLLLLVPGAPALVAAQTPDAAAPALGGGFAQASLAERRQRVQRARTDAEHTGLDEVLEALSDSDDLVRSDLARLLGALVLEQQDAARRLARLESLARADTSSSVRRAALEGLAALRDRPAAEVLARLALELDPSEAPGAALQLVDFARGRELAFERVRDAFRERDSARALPPAILAIWLVSYGRTLAEREGGGDQALDRAPLVLGDVHPAPVVRGAARRALDLCLLRLRELERHERADRLLARLAADGMAARQVLFLRVRAALAEGGVDPEVALAGARELGRTRGGPDDWSDQRWRFRALYLEGLAELALDREQPADVALKRAGDLLDGLLERRVDETGKRGAEEQRDLLHERALVEFARAVCRVAGGGSPDDALLLETLRRAHQIQLEAQLVATAGDADSVLGLDPLFEAGLSPYRLLFAIRPHAAWPPERCLELEQGLGRSLASISAREMPGFEPFEGLPSALADPVQDPRRRAILEEIGRAEIAALRREVERLSQARLQPGADDSALQAQIFMLSLALRRRTENLETGLEERYYDLRMPADEALRLAGALRREGRHEASRKLAERLAAALEERELPAKYPWAVHLEARAHMAIGGGWTDDDQPEQAEAEMLEGLALFEGLRTHYEERGAPQRVRMVEADIAEALVSLAVNANVKAKDTTRALEYFERAYELQQDDFMTILLACYRARSGRAEEARELIAEIPESPRGYYNLACTYAMLDEPARALDLLERDFEENRRSKAALEKQKAWAREDPDLESLRGDPRFEFLTAPAE